MGRDLEFGFRHNGRGACCIWVEVPGGGQSGSHERVLAAETWGLHGATRRHQAEGRVSCPRCCSPLRARRRAGGPSAVIRDGDPAVLSAPSFQATPPLFGGDASPRCPQGKSGGSKPKRRGIRLPPSRDCRNLFKCRLVLDNHVFLY